MPLLCLSVQCFACPELSAKKAESNAARSSRYASIFEAAHMGGLCGRDL
jgi:hypothetical protein